jgi:hypothetical protein
MKTVLVRIDTLPVYSPLDPMYPCRFPITAESELWVRLNQVIWPAITLLYTHLKAASEPVERKILLRHLCVELVTAVQLTRKLHGQLRGGIAQQSSILKAFGSINFDQLSKLDALFEKLPSKSSLDWRELNTVRNSIAAHWEEMDGPSAEPLANSLRPSFVNSWIATIKDYMDFVGQSGALLFTVKESAEQELPNLDMTQPLSKHKVWGKSDHPGILIRSATLILKYQSVAADSPYAQFRGLITTNLHVSRWSENSFSK